MKCKSNLTENVNEQIVVQSYSYDDKGEIMVRGNYVVNVHIITYTPEYLQIELSKTPDFDDNCVFMNTVFVDDSDLSQDNIKQDTSILDSYLLYQKAESMIK